MNRNTHIVVVDDEPDIRETLSEYLSMQGFRMSTADGGAALEAIMAAEPVDLVVLDITMPGEDGLTIARRLRERGGVAIVMVTASGDVIDRIVGLEMGADDYLAKPVDLRELLARVKAVLRRGAATPADLPAAPADSEIAFGRCRLDLDSHKLYDGEGGEIRLTAMEFDLLRAFAEHPDRVLTRDQLLDMAHDRQWDPFDRSIDIRIARIRRKIEDDPAKPQVIKTVRGAGYMFATRA